MQTKVPAEDNFSVDKIVNTKDRLFRRNKDRDF
jgi:hypothetical protein